MSKVTAPLFSLEARKTLANTLTFQKRKSTSVVYLANKPGSVLPFTPSASQLSQRSTIGSRVSAWKALPASFKIQWDDEAERVFYSGTGYHLYIHDPSAFVASYTWSDSVVAWADADISWLGI